MNTAMKPVAVTARRTLGEIAASSPAAVEAFDQLGIDYCCDGGRTLADAAEGAGVGVDLLIKRVQSGASGASRRTPTLESSMDTQALIGHIIHEYHEWHRQDLPLLIELARRVEAVHQFDADTPHGLSETLERLQARLTADMDTEENVLFPALHRGDHATARTGVDRLQAGKRRYSDDIHAIEAICNGFDLPPGACQSWQRLYFGCARLVDELRYHVHLEYNVLFPRLHANTRE